MLQPQFGFMKSEKKLSKTFFFFPHRSVLGDMSCVNWYGTKLGFRFGETEFVDGCGIFLNKGAVQQSYSVCKPAFHGNFITRKCSYPPFLYFLLHTAQDSRGPISGHISRQAGYLIDWPAVYHIFMFNWKHVLLIHLLIMALPAPLVCESKNWNVR